MDAFTVVRAASPRRSAVEVVARESLSRRGMRRTHAIAALAVAALVSLRASGAPEDDALQAARFPAAWALSRGEGATVAVVSTDAALVALVSRAAPAAQVVVPPELAEPATDR